MLLSVYFQFVSIKLKQKMKLHYTIITVRLISDLHNSSPLDVPTFFQKLTYRCYMIIFLFNAGLRGFFENFGLEKFKIRAKFRYTLQFWNNQKKIFKYNYSTVYLINYHKAFAEFLNSKKFLKLRCLSPVKRCLCISRTSVGR